MNINSIAAPVRAAVCVALIASFCGGCYLLDSARGQISLMSKRKPIIDVIDEPATPAALRTQLQAVTQIRNFAVSDLDLPDNGSYRTYADVGRPYVVWNVVVAPQFSVDPKEWCYPFVGCVAYRGYFSEAKARKFAATQRGAGLEVVVGGVAAYSTLGHFDDPILNTMVEWNDVELAAIIFHELTHQLLYVPNDASFNEAFATTVEDEGVRRWLHHEGRDGELAAYLAGQARYREVIDLLTQSRAELKVLYASGVGPAQMLQGKEKIFAKMHVDYAALKAGWGGHAPFDEWFKEDINNAYLASIATYYACVPGFERELQAVDGNLPAFYRRVHQLAKLDQKARDLSVCGRSSEVTGAAPDR